MNTYSHFARSLIGQCSALDVAMGRTPMTSHVRATSSMHTSSSAAHGAVGLPTLGDTGVKFNSSKWASGAEEGLSVFDMRGAYETLEKGPQPLDPSRRAHPAQLAHAARIARAQQMGFTIHGYKVFPDLTPGRAFMWGSILAVYAVGVTSYCVARQVGITSVDDIRTKMQAAFAPYKEALQAQASSAKAGIELKEQPEVFGQLREVGASISRTLGKTETLLEPNDTEQTAH